MKLCIKYTECLASHLLGVIQGEGRQDTGKATVSLDPHNPPETGILRSHLKGWEAKVGEAQGQVGAGRQPELETRSSLVTFLPLQASLWPVCVFSCNEVPSSWRPWEALDPPAPQESGPALWNHQCTLCPRGECKHTQHSGVRSHPMLTGRLSGDNSNITVLLGGCPDCRRHWL